MNKYIKEVQNGNVKFFYKSRAWQKKRLEIIKRDNYECQKCKNEGKYKKAECVHHIQPLKLFSNLALENSNLISLCNECHNLEHSGKLEKMIKMNKKEPKTPERW